MTSGERILITGGAGAVGSNLADLLVEQGAGEIVILDNFVRGRRDNLAWARGERARHGRRGRHLRPRARARARARASTSSSTRRRCASPSAPRSRGSRSRCSSTARSTSSRRPSTRGVRKLVAASSASVYGLAEAFPTAEDHHPYDNDTLYGAAKTFNEGLLRSFHAMKRPRLRRAALLQRLRPADGHPRRLHRGAGALDGADRGRRAAADLRRRHADDGLRLRRRHRPRERARRARATSPTRSSTSPAAPRRACSSSPTMLLRGHGLRPRRRARPRARRSTRCRAAWPTRRGARAARLRGRGRPRGGPDPARRVVAAHRGDGRFEPVAQPLARAA